MKKSRPSGELAESTARKISILVELLRSRKFGIERGMKLWGISERQILRDFQELRGLGETLGFKITQRKNGFVELAEFASRPGSLAASEQRLNTLVVELFKAFGEPLKPYAEGLADGATGSPFVKVVMPQLIAGSDVAKSLDELRAAWENGARVRFKYKGKEREVEPAVTMVRSGRYYLVGRQVGAGGETWRIFSIDEIVGPIHRCGTFAPKKPPEEYLQTDSVGWIKTGRKQNVEVTVSKAQAHTAASRLWQSAQQSRENKDGTWTLTFSVGDVDEVVRWSLGFGEEAWISAPAAAVERARQIVGAIAQRYA